MMGRVSISLVELAEPITDREQIRLSKNPPAAKAASCRRCQRRVNALQVYRVADGRVCRRCVGFVQLFGESAPSSAKRLPPSNGLTFPPPTSWRKLRQVFDPIADRNLPCAIVLTSLPVSRGDIAPGGWRIGGAA